MTLKKKLSDTVNAEYSKEDMVLRLKIEGESYFRLEKKEILKLRDFLNFLDFTLDLKKKLK